MFLLEGCVRFTLFFIPTVLLLAEIAIPTILEAPFFARRVVTDGLRLSRDFAAHIYARDRQYTCTTPRIRST